MHPPPFNAPALETMSRLLPAFEFTALVASNELGAVYAANQRSLDRMVAIKVLSPHVSGNPKFRESFEVTARTMAKLNHPNLIGVYDSGFLDQMLYFVMEFIPGKSLECSAQGHCVEPTQALTLIEGICSGLSHTHDHGIVHGGVEPSIILLNQKAEPKIGNFGFNDSIPGETPCGPEENPYIAPEIKGGEVPENPLSDIYSVGAILYQLLTGHPQRAEAPAPSSLSNCDPEIDRIWGKATHSDPTQRFPGMHAFHNEIAGLLKPSKGSGARGAPVTQVLARRVSPQNTNSTDNPPPIRSQTQVVHHVGTNWHLIRNLFINAGLVVAIFFAWGNYKSKMAQHEKDISQALVKEAADKQKAISDAIKKASESNAAQVAQQNLNLPSGTGPVVPNVETPEESLANLRIALAAGKRDVMPVGSVQKGESWYFVVKEPMSWPEAAWFAGQHGAHLAIPGVGADLKWLVDNVSLKQAVWIGAARSGSQTWALADGTPWKPAKEPDGTGSSVGVDKDGFLHAASMKIQLPSVIQWHRDGKNPGALEALLATTRQSLGSPGPVFPPGTRTFENRSFLVVCRPINWNDAVDLAKQSGGNLAVPATVGEIALLEELTNDVDARNGMWLGGSLKGNQWTWITGEPWTAAKWAKDAVSNVADTAVIIQPGKNWNSLNVSSMASGFVIEWSADAKSIPLVSGGAPGAVKSTVSDTEALALKAKELIQSANLKRNEQLNANAKKFVSDMDSHIPSLPLSAQQVWRREADKLKNSIDHSRVPSMILIDSGIRINQTMDGIIKYCSKKQDQIDEEFVATVGKIHAAYLVKIRESILLAGQTGQTLLAQSLADTLRQAEGMEPWVSAMGFELRPANPKQGARE